MDDMTREEYYENLYGYKNAQTIMNLLDIRDSYEEYSAGWYTANTDYENFMKRIDPNYRSHFDDGDDDN